MMITSKKAAEILGVTPSRVKQICNSGELPSVKMPNGRRMIAESDVERLRLKRESMGRQYRRDGINSIDDLKKRCEIDDFTGCWNYAGPLKSRTSLYLPINAANGVNPNVSSARAAWILSGWKIKPGYMIYHKHHKCGKFCANPSHLAQGNYKEMNSAFVNDGRLKGDAKRAATAINNAIKGATPPDMVARVESMLDSGMTREFISRELRMSINTVRKIALKQHPNCAGHQSLVRGASIFAMGAA